MLSEISLSDEQFKVYAAVRERLGQAQVQTIGGYAGTGKTVLTASLSDAFPGFAVCAYTGKAAHVLRGKGVQASTIHARIYRPVSAPTPIYDPACEDPPPPPPPTFELRNPWELECEGFLVDEASMISRTIHDDLLSFDLPCVFVGDHGQLPPVGDNDVHLMQNPDHRLETLHRNAGPIARFAEHLRHGEAARDWHPSKEVNVLPRKALDDDILRSASQVICAFNNTRVEMNRRVRRLFGRTAPLVVGDRIICLRNDKKAGLFNGMQGVVQEVLPARKNLGPRLSFVDEKGDLFHRLVYDPAQFGSKNYHYVKGGPHPFDYAYCVTCHKAQGSEWPHVVVCEERCARWEHERWAYTAASRAQQQLTWVVKKLP